MQFSRSVRCQASSSGVFATRSQRPFSTPFEATATFPAAFRPHETTISLDLPPVRTWWVNWSPNGRTIVTVDWAGAVRLTDVATGRDLGPPFQIGENRFPYALFTPDGNDVVVTDDSGCVWIFPAAVEAWADHACVVANRSFTRAEWREFVPGRPYYEVCPAASGG